MGFFQEGSASLPALTALKNSCSVRLATSRKRPGTCGETGRGVPGRVGSYGPVSQPAPLTWKSFPLL